MGSKGIGVDTGSVLVPSLALMVIDSIGFGSCTPLWPALEIFLGSVGGFSFGISPAGARMTSALLSMVRCIPTKVVAVSPIFKWLGGFSSSLSKVSAVCFESPWRFSHIR